MQVVANGLYLPTFLPLFQVFNVHCFSFTTGLKAVHIVFKVGVDDLIERLLFLTRFEQEGYLQIYRAIQQEFFKNCLIDLLASHLFKLVNIADDFLQAHAMLSSYSFERALFFLSLNF